MTTPAPKVGDIVLTTCKGPCGQTTPHEVIRPVSRGRTYVSCRQCSSVTSLPNEEIHRG